MPPVRAWEGGISHNPKDEDNHLRRSVRWPIAEIGQMAYFHEDPETLLSLERNFGAGARAPQHCGPPACWLSHVIR